MILRWLARSAVALAAVLLVVFAARELPGLALFLGVVCGLVGLSYLVMRRRGMPLHEPEQERGKNERFLRDVPPPSG